MTTQDYLISEIKSLKEYLESECIDMLSEYFLGNKEKVQRWMTTKNPGLGDVSPIDMLNRGLHKNLHAFISQRMRESQSPVSADQQPLNTNNHWSPIETAPKDGTSILMGFSGTGSSKSSASEGRWHDGSKNYWHKEGWYYMDDNLLTDSPCNPDCWHPMIVPPQSLSGESHLIEDSL